MTWRDRSGNTLAYADGDRCSSGPSDSFVRRTRNPDVVPPDRVVRTDKAPGDVVISTIGRPLTGQPAGGPTDLSRFASSPVGAHQAQGSGR